MAGISDSDMSDEEMEGMTAEEKKIAKAKKANDLAGKDVESSGEDSEGLGDDDGLFVNPLAPKKKAAEKEESEEWSDDDSEDGKAGKKKGKDKTLSGKKRKRKGSMDAAQDFFMNEEIEEVPQNDMAAKKKDGYDSMDSDDIAETRILAKRMLRKKARNEILDATYNRYASHEDPDTLPTWFVEDEAKHRYCERLQPTKEEVAEEKRQLKEYNARPSKKVE